MGRKTFALASSTPPSVTTASAVELQVERRSLGHELKMTVRDNVSAL